MISVQAITEIGRWGSYDYLRHRSADFSTLTLEFLMKTYVFSLISAVTLTLSGAAHSITKGEFQTASDMLVLERKAAFGKCEPLARTAKSQCVMEAKGQYDIAQAELDARYNPSAKADMKLREKRATVAYDIAKSRCDELSGNAKDVCRKDAKAAHVSAKADAKVGQAVAEASTGKANNVAQVRKDAVEDKSDALYAAAKERCDALTGDAKMNCVTEAKTKFGKK